MASLTQIRDGLKRTMENQVGVELFCYADVDDLVELPAVVIEPTSGEYQGAMGRGMHCWYFNLYVLCSRAVTVDGQEMLDSLITGGGPNSIPKALFSRPDLGLGDGTEADALSVAQYGGSFTAAKIQMVGAVIKVRVITDGRA